jgi:hypothetical protein
MEEARFESSPNLPKTLMVCVWDGDGHFRFCPPVDKVLETTRSAMEGLACTGVLDLIRPGAIGSAEDIPSPSASSPAGTLGSAAKVSVFDASSSPLHTSTSV